MNKDILRKLQSVNEYRCISILMSTHRSFPENQQDKIRLKIFSQRCGDYKAPSFRVTKDEEGKIK